MKPLKFLSRSSSSHLVHNWRVGDLTGLSISVLDLVSPSEGEYVELLEGDGTDNGPEKVQRWGTWIMIVQYGESAFS